MDEGSKKLDVPDHRPPSTQETAPRLPWANGCGFFGSPDTRDLCSKCYRDSVRLGVPPAPASSSSAAASAPGAAVDAPEGPGDAAARRAKRGKSRCAACGRGVGLMGFECRCGGVFCGAHRYSDRHDCGYDYRGAGRDAIARANPVVRADKVDKL